VNNVDATNTELINKMNDFFDIIGLAITNDSYLLLEQTPGLNELCRLFLKVKPINNEFRVYDTEAVGTLVGKGVFMDYPL
jgi:hypothetical protein